MTRNILAWFGIHKKLSLLIVLMISTITCTLLILVHDIYNACLYRDRNGEYRIKYNGTISLSEFQSGFLSEAQDEGIEFISLSVASGQGEMNQWLYSTELIGSNVRYMYGDRPKKAGDCMQYISYFKPLNDIDLFNQCFDVVGCGMLWNCVADYTLFIADYVQNVNIVEYAGATISPDSDSKKFYSIIRKYYPNAEIKSYDGFNRNEFSARKNMFLSQLVMAMIAIIITAFVVKVVIELQKRDLYIYEVCGGSPSKVSFYYWVTVTIFMALSEFLGAAMFYLIKSFGIITYCENNRHLIYIAALSIEFLIIETVLYKTVRSVCKKIYNDFRRTLSV